MKKEKFDLCGGLSVWEELVQNGDFYLFSTRSEKL